MALICPPLLNLTIIQWTEFVYELNELNVSHVGCQRCQQQPAVAICLKCLPAPSGWIFRGDAQDSGASGTETGQPGGSTGEGGQCYWCCIPKFGG